LNLRRLQFRLRRSLAERGWAGFSASLLTDPGLIFRRDPDAAPLKPFAPRHPFDAQHGVETGGILFPEDLSTGKPGDLCNNGYFGIAPSVFRQLCDRLAIDYRAFTFVDLGSGKGRALLLASEFPFRAIVGVELSSRLHRAAMENVAHYRSPAQRCTNILCVEGDAAEYRLPAGPLVLYMWNAFEGPVFEKVVTALEDSLQRDPREVYVVYVHPELDRRLAASRCFRRLWFSEIEMSEEDYQAYAFPPHAEVCAVYRSVTGETPGGT